MLIRMRRRETDLVTGDSIVLQLLFVGTSARILMMVALINTNKSSGDHGRRFHSRGTHMWNYIRLWLSFGVFRHHRPDYAIRLYSIQMEMEQTRPLPASVARPGQDIPYTKLLSPKYSLMLTVCVRDTNVHCSNTDVIFIGTLSTV